MGIGYPNSLYGEPATDEGRELDAGQRTGRASFPD